MTGIFVLVVYLSLLATTMFQSTTIYQQRIQIYMYQMFQRYCSLLLNLIRTLGIHAVLYKGFCYERYLRLYLPQLLKYTAKLQLKKWHDVLYVIAMLEAVTNTLKIAPTIVAIFNPTKQHTWRLFNSQYLRELPSLILLSKVILLLLTIFVPMVATRYQYPCCTCYTKAI